MATITKGTAHIYGISGSVTGLTIQSYSVGKSFANADEVTDKNGVVIAVRYSDERTSLTVEGLVPSTYTASIGDNLTFTGNGLAFSGHITAITESGEAKGFMRISVTAVDYEGIA
ncbi:hypothetical protein UFOVP779_34 [uncultured Caudovirales phage]|uniref:Uncharacterized protein n=1 Tax=uncultured Caudovirales phage TaxID=2100421 RepID=A0A6J5NTV8_9CAUD|nr:hypothetical protein UFOVP779_34 [uncultured Caudovirales phage]